MSDRIAKIKAYRERMNKKQEEKARIEKSKNDFLISKMSEYYSRIIELLETANACVENDININNFYSNEDYPFGFLKAKEFNGWLNDKSEKIIAFGKYELDVIVSENPDVDNTYKHHYFYVTKDAVGEIKGKTIGELKGNDNMFAQLPASTKNLEEFFDIIERFEKGFYGYVDRIVDTK